MKADRSVKQRTDRVWLTSASCDLRAFIRQTNRHTVRDDYPFASDIVQEVPIYDGDAVRAAAREPERRKAVMAEWVEIMQTGPGIVIFKRAFADSDPVDAATKIFNDIIAEQHANKSAGGDHFGKPGANDRVWNALQKLCLCNPRAFADYYSNPLIAMVAQSWLGTGYQITSQLNVVNPGGAAQTAHRDYHMGFQSADEIERFPAHAHRLSPVLTLQGAVAHCDMPVETGPTLYLPFSQTFEPGYFAYRRAEFAEYFDKHHVQLPLANGDAAFFNPALFHAAGHNRTANVKRMANLLQISSVYGRPTESVDRIAMSRALYPVLLSAADLDAEAKANAVAACADGYAFPTNLDRDPPIGGLAPQTQQQLTLQALEQGWTPEKFNAALEQRRWSRMA